MTKIQPTFSDFNHNRKQIIKQLNKTQSKKLLKNLNFEKTFIYKSILAVIPMVIGIF